MISTALHNCLYCIATAVGNKLRVQSCALRDAVTTDYCTRASRASSNFRGVLRGVLNIAWWSLTWTTEVVMYRNSIRGPVSCGAVLHMGVSSGERFPKSGLQYFAQKPVAPVRQFLPRNPSGGLVVI